MSMKEIIITKEEYEDDGENWQEKLNEKYSVDASKIVDSQRNFDGKKYTYDLWLTEEWTIEDENTYAPLRKKKLRIEAKRRRDKTRLRRFSHKTKRRIKVES